MAGDFSKPTTTSGYTTFPTEIRDLCADIAKMLEGTGSLNPPTGAKRLNSGLLEEWSGAAWAEKSIGYAKKSGDVFTGRIGQSTSGFWAATKDNISTRVDSGFFQSSSVTTAEGWPYNSTWMHLIASTHTNDTNYYSLQLAADFYTQQLYYRSTGDNGTAAWGEILHSNVYTRWWEAGSVGRFYFQGSGRTYIKGGAGVEIRKSGDTTHTVFDEAGSITCGGVVYGNGGGNGLGKITVQSGGTPPSSGVAQGDICAIY